MLGLESPNTCCVFRILYLDGSSKQVKVFDWNRGGAWAHVCRDVSKRDHGDANKIAAIQLVAVG